MHGYESWVYILPRNPYFSQVLHVHNRGHTDITYYQNSLFFPETLKKPLFFPPPPPTAFGRIYTHESNLTWNTWWIQNVTLWSREVWSFLNIFILFYWWWRLEGTNLLFLHDSFFIFGGLSEEDSRGHNQINYFVISD